MSEVKRLMTFVAGKLDWLQRDGENPGDRRAALARLRRGVGKEAGSVPELWQYLYEGFPDELMGKGNAPSYAENAAHTALTLYAMHTQGSGNVHEKDAGSLGTAANKLKRARPNSEPGIKRRFDALAAARTAAEISLHARGLIQLLKQGDIKLDYVVFAADLYNLQFGFESAKRVLRKWGKDFYYSNNKDANDEAASKGGRNA
jgi:CRISPR system Cascade subunit CasB